MNLPTALLISLVLNLAIQFKPQEEYVKPLSPISIITVSASAMEDGSSDGVDQPVSYKASWYGREYCEKYNPKCNMANGQIFDDTKFTAACAKRWSLGQKLLVSYQGKSVTVECSDRGSFEEKYGRVLDLSKAAFAELAPVAKGVLTISIEEI